MAKVAQWTALGVARRAAGLGRKWAACRMGPAARIVIYNLCTNDNINHLLGMVGPSGTPRVGRRLAFVLEPATTTMTTTTIKRTN